MNQPDEVQIVPEQDGQVKPVAKVAPIARALTESQFENVAFRVSRTAREDARIYIPIAGNLSLNDMAAMAIGCALVDELGEVPDLPQTQYVELFWQYVERLVDRRGRR